MRFVVEGPIKLNRYTNKNILTKETQDNLKKDIQADPNRNWLLGACGCYVLAKRFGKSYTPWYVGKAGAQSVVVESLNSRNLNRLNEITNKGVPVVFYLAMQTPTGKVKKITNGKKKGFGSIDFLENWLIAAALAKNKDLLNKKQVKYLKDLYVQGMFNPKAGDKTKASDELWRVLSR